ncbi:MAG: NAD-binding protein, partial [bacterium]|nr:NAD-binding protein [bacterium]
TADPSDTKRLAALCKAKRVPFLDACVSGHSRNVADRVGLFVIGGSKAHYQKVTPLLDRLLSDHIHCGGTAAGATVKILINYLACLQRCSLAETFRMGLRAGVKGDLLVDALKRSAADSRQLRNRGEIMIKRRYGNPVSTLDVLLKDIGLGKKLADKVGALTPIGGASLPIFREAHRSGYGELDSAVVYQVFEDREKKKRRARR